MTRKPSAEFAAYGEATFGSYERIKFEGAAGGPLSDRVRGRVSFLHDENHGYQVESNSGRPVGGRQRRSLPPATGHRP